jgi:hypothetical protein
MLLPNSITLGFDGLTTTFCVKEMPLPSFSIPSHDDETISFRVEEMLLPIPQNRTMGL